MKKENDDRNNNHRPSSGLTVELLISKDKVKPLENSAKQTRKIFRENTDKTPITSRF